MITHTTMVFATEKNPFYHSYFIMKCGINIILQLLLWYFYYGNGKSNRGTVIVVERVFSLAKTIVVDVFVIYIPRIPLWYFLLWEYFWFTSKINGFTRKGGILTRLAPTSVLQVKQLVLRVKQYIKI